MQRLTVSTSGAASDAVRRHLPPLVSDGVAGKLFAKDHTLWGEAAEEESSKRLGWTDAHDVSRPLVDEVLALRDEFLANGVDRVVLCGMGGSSLAPEVIARTAGVALTVLDSTDPAQVAAALADRLERTAVVVSSKSGSTIETDSQRRAFEAAFREAGIDPASRIVVVTDPGSPLEAASRAAGYRVFLADATVGGRFSALTAFGLVPTGLAGVNVAALLDEARAAADVLAVDADENPGLVLGAAIAGGEPIKTYLGIVSDTTSIEGFGDWAEQLIAESTGKDGRGLLPVVLPIDAPEIGATLPDLQVARLVADAADTPAVGDEIAVSGPLGAQLLLWEVAVAVAGRIIGINPYDQPDVESAKLAARGLLDEQPAPTPAAFAEGGIEARGTDDVVEGRTTVASAVDALLAALPEGGYVSVQAYADRTRLMVLEALRDLLAERSRRPVTFGWGPRFLHSTGQFHKGGPKVGVFLQLTSKEDIDIEVPERPFSFGSLIAAQATGDAQVLEAHGRPVLRLELTSPDRDATALLELLRAI
ncbi:glucose-6-phosphate isomerase [Pseudoclavibacter endophyticus]|uniref:Glucose-6-phosphate isomerase n=1 Tax=Pseudoclavibacter endophyticus TaxID=1778590 RepID=A0A6H9WVC2_9MICO|nr:glucose-6-phosphate isomerase [Pseudoclavibacter endophyticus]KAB1650140.1 glucose-6-phosphate isomerase [Pseudoclavibacter endophyticus]GGA56822.1 glucose-6-phosphate isomerase [Pseudoclavibacter endophyticus]